MNIIYLLCSVLFLKITEALKPIFAKYKIFSDRACVLIKSISDNFLSKNNKLLKNNHVQSVIPTDCNLDTKICNKDVIVPGYMEHDPKNASIKKIK